ncbi:MAG: trehalose-phosphatase, partial [Terriglobia bacterium]
AALDGLPGVWIEDKKPAFVVHYRKASAADGRRAVAITRRGVKSHERELYLVEGNKVVDVLPLEIKGKGQAVLDELSNKPDGTLAVYAGDDTTDETAFAALARRGITILVGNRRETQAQYQVRNPQELIGFLQKLQEGLR